MTPLLGILLSMGLALAAPPRLDSILTRPDPEAAVEELEPALVTVLRQRPDGRVDRSGGFWLIPDEGYVVAPLDRVIYGEALAVQDAGGVHGARLVAADPVLRLAVLRVSVHRPALDRPKVVMRYPKPGEPLPLLRQGSRATVVTVKSSLETWVELEGEAPPVGAVLLDSRGGAVGIAVPPRGKRGVGVVPLVHAEDLVKRARSKGSFGRTSGPGEAQEACFAWVHQAASQARGCVDPGGIQGTAREAVAGAEAVLTAMSGEQVALNTSGWSEQLAALLEGRLHLPPADWAEAAASEAPPLLGVPEFHELIYERGGMLADQGRPLEAILDNLSTGAKVQEVVMDGDDAAWVRTAGRNLDGSSWSMSRHWTAFAGSWSLDLDLDAEELAALPAGWPTAIDEGDWLRDLLMARIIAWWKADQAAGSAPPAP